METNCKSCERLKVENAALLELLQGALFEIEGALEHPAMAIIRRYRGGMAVVLAKSTSAQPRESQA